MLFPPGFGVDIVFGEGGEEVVGFFFLIEGEFEELFDLVEVQCAGMGSEAAVGADLVVFELLGGDDEPGVAGGGPRVGGGDDLFRLAGNSEDGFGGVGFGRVAELGENGLEAAEVFLRVVEVTGQHVAELERGRGFFQKGEYKHLLFFGAIKFFKLFQEKGFQLGVGMLLRFFFHIAFITG